MTMKAFLSVISATVILMMTTPCQAQTPVDYAKAGQFFEVTLVWGWNADFQGELKQKYAEGRQLFVKAGAPEKVLKNYDTYAQNKTGFPWSQPWSKWTKEQQHKWTHTVMMDHNLISESLGGENIPPRFFYWLGRKAMQFGYTEPYLINEQGLTFSGELSAIKSALSDIVWLRDSNPDVFKTLVPEVQEPVKNIALYLKKARDPLGEGLVPDDVNKMAEHAKIILKAVRDGKLTR